MAKVTDTDRANSGGTTMEVNTGDMTALRAEVAELAAKVELYHRQAAMIRGFEDAYAQSIARQHGPGRTARLLHSVGSDDAS